MLRRAQRSSRTARVTRAIASRLAAVSKALEDQGHRVDEVAMFVMRCLFTMFAEDVGLLPEKSFKEVLERCEQDPTTFQPDVGQLWQAMDEGGYAYAIRKKVPRFNGEFFKERTVLPLGREEIGNRYHAKARHTQFRTARRALARQALPIHRPRRRRLRHPRAPAEGLLADVRNAGDRRGAGAATGDTVNKRRTWTPPKASANSLGYL